MNNPPSQGRFEHVGMYIHPEGLEKSHAWGVEIAHKLKEGDADQIDRVIPFLLDHATHFNSSGAGKLREGIAADIEATPLPYSDSFVRRIGSVIEQYIDATNQASVIMMSSEVLINEQWKIAAERPDGPPFPYGGVPPQGA